MRTTTRSTRKCVSDLHATLQTPLPRCSPPRHGLGIPGSRAAALDPSSASPSIDPVRQQGLQQRIAFRCHVRCCRRVRRPTSLPPRCIAFVKTGIANPANSAYESPAPTRFKRGSFSWLHLAFGRYVFSAAVSCLKSWWWQYRGTVPSVGLLLHFHLAEQHRGCHS